MNVYILKTRKVSVYHLIVDGNRSGIRMEDRALKSAHPLVNFAPSTMIINEKDYYGELSTSGHTQQVFGAYTTYICF